MIKIEINAEQLERAIHDLPVKERTKLVEKILKDSWEGRFDELRRRIRARVKKYPITQQEIDHEVEEAQKEYYAKSRR